MAATCTGDHGCPTDQHVHGCYEDYGQCDSPEEHDEPSTYGDESSLLTGLIDQIEAGEL